MSFFVGENLRIGHKQTDVEETTSESHFLLGVPLGDQEHGTLNDAKSEAGYDARKFVALTQ